MGLSYFPERLETHIHIKTPFQIIFEFEDLYFDLYYLNICLYIISIILNLINYSFSPEKSQGNNIAILIIKMWNILIF